jgi:hypothetical protein
MRLEEENQQIGSSFDIKPVEPLKWKESSKPGYDKTSWKLKQGENQPCDYTSLLTTLGAGL